MTSINKFVPFETRVRFETEEGYEEGLVVQILGGGKLLYVRDAMNQVYEVSKYHVTII